MAESDPSVTRAEKVAAKAAAKRARKLANRTADEKAARKRRAQVKLGDHIGADGPRVAPVAGIAAGGLGGPRKPFVPIPERLAGIEPSRRPLPMPPRKVGVTKSNKMTKSQKAARDAAEMARLGLTFEELKAYRRDEARRAQELAIRAKASGVTVKVLKRLIRDGAEEQLPSQPAGGALSTNA